LDECSGDVRRFFGVVVVVVADEVGSEEIERKRKPENPFVVSVEAVFFLLVMVMVMMRSAMFLKEFHLNVVAPAIWGSFLLSHFI